MNLFELRERRVQHIWAHCINGDDGQEQVEKIAQGNGHVKRRIMRMRTLALGKAMYSWFHDCDIKKFRQYCFLSALWLQKEYEIEVELGNPRAKVLDMMPALLSNNLEVINWIASMNGLFDLKRRDNPVTDDFQSYLIQLALKKDWEQILIRIEKVRKSPPKSSSEKKYYIDFEFYEALATRNLEGMKSVLFELTTSKQLNSRKNDESGFTEDLISTWAVIYAKLAWLNGFEIEIDSPCIPSEWLPNYPLEKYDYVYDFLR